MSHKKITQSAEDTTEVAETLQDERPSVEEYYGKYLHLCKEVIIPCQGSHEDFIQLRDNMFRDAAPANAIEGMLVDRLVALIWRLRRTHRIEREIMDRITGKITAQDVSGAAVTGSNAVQVMDQFIDKPVMSSLYWLMHYESQLDRSVYRALDELRDQQSERWEREKEAAREVDLKDKSAKA